MFSLPLPSSIPVFNVSASGLWEQRLAEPRSAAFLSTRLVASVRGPKSGGSSRAVVPGAASPALASGPPRVAGAEEAAAVCGVELDLPVGDAHI